MTSNDEEQRLRDKYRAANRKLVELYGHPQWRQHLPPVDELVSTILSQSTSDTNRDKGFNALKDRFPDWQSVAYAPVDEIIDTIYSAGLANQKGPRIQNALLFIISRRGELDLDFLNDMPLDEARAWLMQIKGVGLKTASIILLFSFDRPVFPVDTHVHRVTRRLGLVDQRASADKAHQILENIGDPATYYAMHLNLISHGRQVCLAQRPRCETCGLQTMCDYYQSLPAIN